MPKIELTIKGKVYGKGRPRFYGGKAFTPKETREYEEFLRWAFLKECPKWQIIKDKQIKIDITAYVWQEREGLFKKKPDSDNICKIILDSFNGLVYSDDSQVNDLHIKKLRCTRGADRLQITIETYDE